MNTIEYESGNRPKLKYPVVMDKIFFAYTLTVEPDFDAGGLMYLEKPWDNQA